MILNAILVLTPVFFLINSSLRETSEFSRSPFGLARNPYWGNYSSVWSGGEFPTYLLNSFVITGGSLVLIVILSVGAGFVLARYSFRGSNLVLAFVLTGMLVPAKLAILPLFIQLKWMGLLDSRIGLILVYTSAALPAAIFIMSGFFRSLPLDLDSAARIDGASEFQLLRKVLAPLVNPERPYGVVLGGAKVSDKIGVISNLLNKVNVIAIGGGMVFTFLAAQNKQIGKSLVEIDLIPTVKELINRAEQLGVKLILPTDIVVAKEFSETSQPTIVSVEEIPDDQMGLDIGPKSAKNFAAEIKSCKTVFWNGPMGVFEFANFANGTKTIAQALTEIKAMTVVGGGDSAAAVRKLGFKDKQFGYISTGGGASLEYLEGKELPGLVALS